MTRISGGTRNLWLSIWREVSDTCRGGGRDLMQRLRADERKRDNYRDKDGLLLRYIDEGDRIVR